MADNLLASVFNLSHFFGTQPDITEVGNDITETNFIFAAEGTAKDFLTSNTGFYDGRHNVVVIWV